MKTQGPSLAAIRNANSAASISRPEKLWNYRTALLLAALWAALFGAVPLRAQVPVYEITPVESKSALA